MKMRLLPSAHGMLTLTLTLTLTLRCCRGRTGRGADPEPNPDARQVQEMLAVPLQQAGYKADDVMSLMMQIKAFESVDPSIKEDTDKLMKAVQGDLSDFL